MKNGGVNTKSLKRQPKHDLSISDFEQFVSLLLTHPDFKTYQCALLTEGHALSVSNSDQTNLIFIASEIWSHDERYHQLKKDSDRIGSALICVGTEEILSQIASQMSREEHLFCFPLTISQIKSQIGDLFGLQSIKLQSLHNRQYVEATNNSIKYVLRVSRELNGIRDTNKLLSLILKKAREICNADAGSIYVVKWKDTSANEGTIHFKVSQNESVTQNLSEFQIPISTTSIVGNAILHQKSINIPDLYKLNPDRTQNPYGAQHDRTWDKKIGYQCRSMLTLPMFDISNQVIGVIQLINSKIKGVDRLLTSDDFDEKVLVFDETKAEYTKIMAHQAGIALENALLTEEREQLFEGFVYASVTAIEQRDPTTSGHSHRVATLTVGLARQINEIQDGPYADLFFTEDQIKELEFSALLHDFGKLSVSEDVLLKDKKLHPWQKKIIDERFEHAYARYEIEYLENLIRYMEAPSNFPPGFSPEMLLDIHKKKRLFLKNARDSIFKANESEILVQDDFDELKQIAGTTFRNSRDEIAYLLNEAELKALSISRGFLTRDEQVEIRSHVSHTYEFLRKIPWGEVFANVPQIAAKHHEKMDGSGYPTSAIGDEITVQSRMIIIADIFDVLTAADRPFRKKMNTDAALKILEIDAKSGKIDQGLLRIFIQHKVYEAHMVRQME